MPLTWRSGIHSKVQSSSSSNDHKSETPYSIIILTFCAASASIQQSSTHAAVGSITINTLQRRTDSTGSTGTVICALVTVRTREICKHKHALSVPRWMNIYFTEVFRLVHHFTCIYTSSWISHTSDSHKSFNIDIYISFVLPAVRASFIQGLYFWFRVLKVIIPVYQYITKFFLRFSTLATGTLRSWSARHQFDACAPRWCPTDANPSAPLVRAVSTFSFVLKEEMKTSVGIPEEVALSSWSP